MKAAFEWDPKKDRFNRRKHGVSFSRAQHAFADPDRIVMQDVTHSAIEDRYYCMGRAGGGILTVRFTYRAGVIRIFGAGFWRRGRAIYEKKNKIHR